MTDTPNNGRVDTSLSDLEINFVDEEAPPSSQKKEAEMKVAVEDTSKPKEQQEEIQILISDCDQDQEQQEDKEIEVIDLDEEEEDGGGPQIQISSQDSSSSSWDEEAASLEFLTACKTGNLEDIENLLTKAPEMSESKLEFELVMMSKIKGSYPIHVILENAQDGVLKYFLEKKKHVGQWLQLHSMPCLSLALKTMLIPKLRERAYKCFLLLNQEYKFLMTERDRLGRTSFHWACIAGSQKAVQVLLKSGAKVNDEQDKGLYISDLEDKQPVHYAIERGHAKVLALLVSDPQSQLNQLGSELLVESGEQETLIQRAIRYSSWKCLLTLLSAGGMELLTIPNSKGQLPAAAAKEANNEKEFEKVLDQFKKAQDKDKVIASVAPSQQPTLLITSNQCNMHKATEQRYKGYPEKPERLECLFNSQSTGILQGIQFKDLVVKKTAPTVKVADVLRVHEYSYFERLEEIVTMLKKRDELSQAGTPPATYHLDSDTYMNQYTLNAAKVAAGSVIAAIDEVISQKVRNAFVAVRPPGHHCGPFGAVSSPSQPEATSNGFCFFNNAAIGAAYIRCMKRGNISRVAIVDFDVHHGNGTQQIIQNLRPSKMKMRVDVPFTKGFLEYSSYKPWLDEEDSKNVLFISSHGYDELGYDFYPMSGVECTKKDDPDYPGGILNLPYPKYASSAHFRETYTTNVFPRLAQFKPQFIIVSAGFDAHQEDQVNDNFGQWNEHDYAWLTEQLIKIANTYSEGRIVSILEGGYCIKGNHLSPFAESVATHVLELSRPNLRLYKPLSEEEAKLAEKEEEKRMLRKREMRVSQRLQDGLSSSSLRKRKTEADQNPLEGRQEEIEQELEKNGNKAADQEGKSKVGDF